MHWLIKFSSGTDVKLCTIIIVAFYYFMIPPLRKQQSWFYLIHFIEGRNRRHSQFSSEWSDSKAVLSTTMLYTDSTTSSQLRQGGCPFILAPVF